MNDHDISGIKKEMCKRKIKKRIKKWEGRRAREGQQKIIERMERGMVVVVVVGGLREKKQKNGAENENDWDREVKTRGRHKEKELEKKKAERRVCSYQNAF